MNRLITTPHIMLVTSGNGGAGKSAVTLNLATACQRQGQRVLMIDADWKTGALHILANANPSQGIRQGISGAEVKTIITPLSGGVDLIAPATIDDVTDWPDAAEMLAFIERIRGEASHYDLILVDTPVGMLDPVTGLICGADSAVMVVNPDLSSIANTYGLYKWLNHTDQNVSISMLINRASGPDEATDIAERFATITSRFVGSRPFTLGFIREERAIREALSKQITIFGHNEHSPAAKQFALIASRLSQRLFKSSTGALTLNKMSTAINSAG